MRLEMVRELTIILTLLISACATAPPGRYGESGSFSFVEIDLRQDFTFTYTEGVDYGHGEWVTEGTWRWVDQNNGELETIAEKWSGGRKDSSGYLPERVVWRVTGFSIERKWRRPLPRL